MEVDLFISEQNDNIRSIMEYFHELLMSIPGIEAKIRYKIPFYYRKSWICYLNPTNDNSVEFAFPRGNELPVEQGILESKGRKQVRSITIKKLEEIPQDLIKELIYEACLLDEKVKYASKRTKKL
jgi:hypothetical protein